MTNLTAIYIETDDGSTAFYLDDACIMIEEPGSAQPGKVEGVAHRTARALGIPLRSYTGVPCPDRDGWDMREVRDVLRGAEG